MINPSAVVQLSGIIRKVEFGTTNIGNTGIRIPIPSISIRIVKKIVHKILLLVAGMIRIFLYYKIEFN